MPHRLVCALLVAALAAGCALIDGNSGDTSDDVPPPPPGLSLTASQEVYSSGDTLRVTLRNETPAPIGYNLCLIGAERQTGSGWDVVPLFSEWRACLAVLYTLEPGDAATAEVPLRDGLLSGTYRVRESVEWIGSGERVELAARFEVR